MLFQKKEISTLSFNPFKEIGSDWYLLTAGTLENYNTMTASWGFMGFMWGTPSFSCGVRTNRHTFSFMEENEYFTASFFDESYRSALQFCGTRSGRDYDKAKETGLTPIQLDEGVSFEEAKKVIVCRKQFASMMDESSFTSPETYQKWYSKDPCHKQYIGEIVAIYEKTVF
ncbi:MAG: flavin reductase [Ruminococcus sp.]|nr:flavin reductase [Ruminococcus sp.]